MHSRYYKVAHMCDRGVEEAMRALTQYYLRSGDLALISELRPRHQICLDPPNKVHYINPSIECRDSQMSKQAPKGSAAAASTRLVSNKLVRSRLCWHCEP